jgi:hypothetical protein
MTLDAHIPPGPLEKKWTTYKNNAKIISPANKRKHKLIIVGMQDGQLDTVYRARALLASLTASARTTQFFQQNAIADYATFLDFLKLLGFKLVTITDGGAFTHQISIE